MVKEIEQDHPLNFQGLNPIQRLLCGAVEDDAQKALLLTLSVQDSQDALDEIWTLLELPLLPHTTFGVQSPPARNKLRRLSLKIALRSDILPRALFLTTVLVRGESRASGGFADVYCGEYDGQVVAIKRLRVYVNSPLSQRMKLKQAFCRETLLWKNLSHRHVLPFLGVSEDLFDNNSMCMVLPWMWKGGIRHYIDSLNRGNGFSTRSFTECVDEWLYQVAAGLAYLHEEGIVHGDLHGGNILVDADETIRLTDFGMALIAKATSYQYGSIHGGGAVRWQAPELLDPDEFGLTSTRPTFASDVYSFALTSIELYTDDVPFSTLTELQLMRRIVNGERPVWPENMSRTLWILLQSYWGHPATRPPLSEVVSSLNRITLVPTRPTFGRYRPPTKDIRAVMNKIFLNHTDHAVAGKSEPTVPSGAAHDILAAFLTSLDFEILTPAQVSQLLEDFVGNRPTFPFTPSLLLGLISTIPGNLLIDSPSHVETPPTSGGLRPSRRGLGKVFSASSVGNSKGENTRERSHGRKVPNDRQGMPVSPVSSGRSPKGRPERVNQTVRPAIPPRDDNMTPRPSAASRLAMILNDRLINFRRNLQREGYLS
ncbi:kinase-like domain-containing protein [Cristinia sonorae]|uniref:Kinase-like domain-containing protein n=1 Tax=Cristinia sonorae TaxID=1940300 RepID=A0A8K0UFJ9_9AGAR|nr:kinase-like domain-containing protein [Cristinia sonorae]